MKVDSVTRFNFVSFNSQDYSRSSVLLNGRYENCLPKFTQMPNRFLHALSYVIRNRKIFNEDSSVTVVMSPSNKLTAILKLATKSPVILDAGWPQIDGMFSRGLKFRQLGRFIYVFLLDLLSFHTADAILLESEAQVKRVGRIFKISKNKLQRSFTGCNEALLMEGLPSMQFNNSLEKEIEKRRRNAKIIVLFRGKINRESGFQNILGAAQNLSDQAIFILAIGSKVPKVTVPKNCIVVNEITWAEMRTLYQYADVCLGQISNLERLNYTIPHKAFEAGYFGKPYVTTITPPLLELYSVEALSQVTEATSASLAEALKQLFDERKRIDLSKKITRDYESNSSQEKLAFDLLGTAKSLLHIQ